MQAVRAGNTHWREARYGYDVVLGEGGRSRVPVHQVEAEVVRKLFAMYLAEPVGFKPLARRLDELGIPTREGGSRSHMSVKGILQNRWVVGQQKYKKRRFVLDDESGNRLPKWRYIAGACSLPGRVRENADEALRAVFWARRAAA